MTGFAAISVRRLGWRSVPRSWALFALVAVAYAAGAELSWQSFSSGAAFGFPPAGVTVAAMLLTRRRMWPVIIAAIVLSEVIVDLQHGLTVPAALVSVAANVVEPLGPLAGGLIGATAMTIDSGGS